MKSIVLSGAMLALLCGEANAQNYRSASKFEQAKAECELVADQLNEGVTWHTVIGSAIGGAVRHARTYDNCMVLKGYTKTQ